jgi:glycosyltransferase involved in cell wall biosynthesis
MKVCLVSRQFYPATVGGSELYMYEIYRRIREKNEVRILTYDKVDHKEACVLPLPRTYLMAPLFSLIAGLKVRLRNYDVVHINAYWSEFAGLFTRKSILTVHDVGLVEERGVFNRIKAFILKKAMNKAEKVVTVSEKEKKRIAESFGIDKGKIVVIPNGVDLERYNPKNSGGEIRRRYKIEDKKIILSVGRFSRNKGYEYLIEAFKEISQKFSDVCLIIAGAVEDKKYLRELKDMVRGMSDVILLQNISEDEKVKLLAACDVYCQPSVSSEGFGISLLEAMASGKPCIATDVFSGVEHIPEEFLVKSRNEKELADKIIELLTSDYKKIGEKMRKRAEKYSWDSTANEILRLYEKVIS